MVFINFATMCLIFGTTFLAIKVGIDAGMPPFFSAGIRFLLAGLLILCWMLRKNRAVFSLLLRKEMWLTGLCLTFGTFSTLYWAEQYVTSGLAAILSATGPMVILLLQASVLKQHASRNAVLGCAVGFAGVVLLLLPSVTFSMSLFWLLGCLTILIGECFYAAGTLYSRKVIQHFHQTSPIALNAAQMVCGGALLLLLSSLTEQVHVEAVLTAKGIASLLYLIVFGSMMGHTIYYWLVAKTNPVFPSTWLYVSPLIALVLGIFLYQEMITWMMAVGAVIIVGGLVLVNFDALRGMIQRKQTVKI